MNYLSKMQPIDPNTLFSIFEQGDEQVYDENGVLDTLDNPFVLMGMVLRGLENYHMMDMMYMKQYPQQYKNVRKLTRYKYYNKLYGYLTRIDFTKYENIYKIGTSFGKEDVLYGLDKLLYYFEGLEQYEKCAVIKKYCDLLKKTKVTVGTLI